MARKYTLKWQETDTRDIIYAPKPVDLNQTFDLAPGFPEPPYDQGALGSCTSNEAAGLVAFDQKKQGLKTDRPSRLYIYWNNRYEDGGFQATLSDGGATIRDSLKSLGDGWVSEASWPYSDDPIRYILPAPWFPWLKATEKAVTYESVTQKEEDISSALAEGFPVAFGIEVFPGFEDADVAKTGIIPMPGQAEQSIGGHAIVIVGKVFINGKKYFKFRNSWGCYDAETEVLTKDGWKLFKDVTYVDEIATLNPDNHELEYHRATNYIERPYEGVMHQYTSRSIDLTVTPNHSMYVRGWKGEFYLKKSQDLKGFFKVKKDCYWVGVERSTYKFGQYEVDMDTWLEFLGYFLSEGHTCRQSYSRPARTRARKSKVLVNSIAQRNTVTGRYEASPFRETRDKVSHYVEKASIEERYYVGITQIKKESIPVMQSCMDRLPFGMSRTKKGWCANNKDVWEELSKYGKSFEKYIPKYVKTLSSRQLMILYRALMLGDGSSTKGKNTYYTSSRKLADDFQELLLKINYCGDIRTINRIGRVATNGVTRHVEYQIRIKQKYKETAPEGGFKVEEIPYNGNVYCLEVPNHIMYVRKNGNAVWCGNSSWGDGGYGYLPLEYVLNPDLASDFWILRSIT